MKLNNVIILTISDFRRHFNFLAFWNSRLSFVRDMDPDQVFYFDEDDKKNYERIAQWIKAEQDGSSTPSIRQTGLTALSRFAKCNVTEKDWKKAVGMLDFSADIIVVEGGGMLKLPGHNMTEEEASEFAKNAGCKERLHKIEVDGDKSTAASIFIGGKEMLQLKGGECVYATEIGNGFLRILPNHLSKGPYTLRLENISGSFESFLIEEYYLLGRNETRHKGVTQFRFSKQKPSRPIYNSDKYYVLND